MAKATGAGMDLGRDRSAGMGLARERDSETRAVWRWEWDKHYDSGKGWAMRLGVPRRAC